MVDNVLRYKCDCCGSLDFSEITVKEPPKGWTIGTEMGDLCPNCSKFWETTKQDFIERMRK